jgi:NADPH:quinone reductase-like Zn-dependent oxidoreductase
MLRFWTSRRSSGVWVRRATAPCNSIASSGNLGSDDFARADKEEAARAINEALIGGWNGMPIVERFPLDEIAVAHERLEASRPRGRVVVLLS